jgi:nicotinamidase/pyrazinamidase
VSTVFFDVDTQLDFLLPAGALYVPDAEHLIPAFTRLTQHAGARELPLISTMDAHSENDAEFGTWKPHCVVGTVGQQKITGTLLGRSLTIASGAAGQNSLVASTVLTRQFLVEKQTIDPFSNPNLDLLLNELGADSYVVYGVVTEVCVQQAIFGLLDRGKRVQVVTDAIRSLVPQESESYLHAFKNRGARLITEAEALAI